MKLLGVVCVIADGFLWWGIGYSLLGADAPVILLGVMCVIADGSGGLSFWRLCFMLRTGGVLRGQPSQGEMSSFCGYLHV